jgi:hypothetical protein
LLRTTSWLPALCVALMACLSSVPAFAADTSCQAVFDAMSKVLTMPAHMYTTEPSLRPGDKARNGELIYFGGAIYVKVNDKWTRSKMTAQQMLQQEKENQEHSKTTCHYLRDEAVNGDAAAVYSVHSENEDIKSEGPVWISKKGLPLHEELDSDIGDPGKMHPSVRYEYGNVQAPPI